MDLIPAAGRNRRIGKHMTAREKKDRAQARAELRAIGILPPRKKTLNRERFCGEAKTILREIDISDVATVLGILWALAEMLEHRDAQRKLSGNAVGAAKVVKLAKARKDFEEARREAGKPSTYTLGELYEAVKGVYEA